MPDSESPEQLPSVDALQFRRAQPINNEESPAEASCVACKQLIHDEYFKVQNQVICPECAAKIEAGRQAAKSVPMLRPVIYGVGAAVAGCILYAIPLAMGFQIGIVALAVGWMVGKAIRHASYGLGGRPQQILAVGLTYFAISTSTIPAMAFIWAKKGVVDRSGAKKQSTRAAPPTILHLTPEQRLATGEVVTMFVVTAAIGPFLMLEVSPVSGLISLFILFIGLQRAWALTARREILVTGPYT